MSKSRILYISRAFLDYRVPVFEELDRISENNLYVIYSKKLPERVWRKLEKVIGVRAVGFSGEYVLGYKGNITKEMANTFVRIPIQPGLLREIYNIRPSIIIADGFSEWTIAGLFYSIFKNVPLVLCYERTAYTERNSQWYRRLFRKVVLRFVDAMCVNGVLSKEYVESLGFNPEKITTGHMVSDTNGLSEAVREITRDDIEEYKRQYNISVDTKVFLSVGQLIKRKGIDKLLCIWSKLQNEYQVNATLVIVGSGPEQQLLEDIVESNIIANVVFAGNVDYDKIHMFYALADVFVISTLEDNWSLVVPEAMSCKKPILCSKYNGCWPELVKDGINGYVFDPYDSDKTAMLFNSIISDSKSLMKMGEKSYDIVRPFTPSSAAVAIEKACNIAINNRAR